MLIILDSTPILQIPPFKINFILLPNSSLTSAAFTALNLEEILALGAATGYFRFLSNFLNRGCFGNRIATVFLLLVTNFDILEFFLSFSTYVIGPGENFL